MNVSESPQPSRARVYMWVGGGGIRVHQLRAESMQLVNN